MNLASQEQGFASKWWGTEAEWARIGGQVYGTGTEILGDMTVFNAEQVQCLATEPYRVSQGSPATVDYGPAERIISASGADIRFRFGIEALYFYPPADYILFPLREQFEQGAGGLPGYYDSLFHELVHRTEPRLGWRGNPALRELRAEIAAPFLAAQLGIPVLTDMSVLMNHSRYLPTWIKAIQHDPTVLVRTAENATEAVDYLRSRTG
jgi:antirestriction protein ArdC